MKILINARAGAGKDTVADYLVRKYNFTKITFATPIYEIAYKYFNMQYKDRNLLQQIGQSMRKIDNDIWVNYAFRVADNYENVVISDCRQENEFLMGMLKDYVPIRVNADLDKRIERLISRDGLTPDIKLFEHKAETGADNFMYNEIDNNGTVEELYEKIDDLMKVYGGYKCISMK